MASRISHSEVHNSWTYCLIRNVSLCVWVQANVHVCLCGEHLCVCERVDKCVDGTPAPHAHVPASPFPAICPTAISVQWKVEAGPSFLFMRAMAFPTWAPGAWDGIFQQIMASEAHESCGVVRSEQRPKPQCSQCPCGPGLDWLREPQVRNQWEFPFREWEGGFGALYYYF